MSPLPLGLTLSDSGKVVDGQMQVCGKIVFVKKISHFRPLLSAVSACNGANRLTTTFELKEMNSWGPCFYLQVGAGLAAP